jgi:hypothetical protein
MKELLSRKFVISLLVYCLADIITIGMGMGVPIFSILFGFIIGWLIPKLFSSEKTEIVDLLRKCIYGAIFASLFTLLIMMLLWGTAAKLLLNPNSDYINFGIPMILYEPKTSFIGWMILMVFISPFLQLLSIVFSFTIRIIFMKIQEQ